jgi:transposase
MVVVGVDVHKRSHTFVAVDEAGRKVGELTVRATSEGHDRAVRWAETSFGAGPDALRWGIEDCRHLSARLEIDLLEAGQSVVRVPPKLMAEQRRVARTRGKSDPIDALAVARAVLREPDLPVASHDEASRELKLLVDHRDDLVAHRTAVINRFRWHLHRIDPQADPAPKSLKLAKTRERLAALLDGLDAVDGVPAIDVRSARELLGDIDALTSRVNALEALRCLKRRLARVGFNTLKNNPSTATRPTQATAA